MFVIKVGFWKLTEWLKSYMSFTVSDSQIHITKHTKKPRPFTILLENILGIPEHWSNKNKAIVKIKLVIKRES